MENMSGLELLQPEILTLIMLHVSEKSGLHALLRASPKIYHVFLSRRNYILTHLATKHGISPGNAWDAVRTSKLPKPPPDQLVKDFVSTFLEDMGYEVAIIPVEVSIGMIRLEHRVRWLVDDFARDTLGNLVKLDQLIRSHGDRSITQDVSVLQRPVSETEMWRMARAFYRLETFRHLFRHHCENRHYPPKIPDLAVDYLKVFEDDEFEEIACVRDYVIRRLWLVFDLVEDAFAKRENNQALREAAQVHREENWFGSFEKFNHDYDMEHMMSLGLDFLQQLFSANSARRCELVLSNSVAITGFLTDTIEKIVDENAGLRREEYRYGPYGIYTRPFHEDSGMVSFGWHWAKKGMGRGKPGAHDTKGCRDWGYIFWDQSRLQAAGILSEGYSPLLSHLNKLG